MGFENVESIFIDNKEVQSIVVKDSGAILFQKSNDIENLPVMTLTVTGSSFETPSSTPFTYTGKVFVDWGDNSGLVEYTRGKLSHSFTDGVSNHTVCVYGNLTSLGNNGFAVRNGLTQIIIPSSVTSIEIGCFNTCSDLTSITIPDGVTSIGPSCFNACRKLTSITIPNSVTDLGTSCFNDCSGLTSLHFNWNSSTNILTYNSTWIWNEGCKFIIPYGTTQLYIDKGYPSSKLEEEIPFNNVVLSADNPVLSYYHNDSCTLTAQLMYDNTPINLAGVTVIFSTGGDKLATVQTNASGVATTTYTIEEEPKFKVDTYTYIIATAENFESNECEIQNCLYAPNQQYDITRNGTTVITKLNNDVITNLPSSYIIEFDMKSSNTPTYGAEQRIYWAPNDLWTGTGQPSLAAFVGYCYSSTTKLEAGRRLNAQTAETNSKTVTPTEWSHIKIDKRADQTYHFFYNDEEDEYCYWTISGGENYTDWIFGIILWSNTTFSIKNLKIISTVPKVHINDGDDEVEGATTEIP